MARGTQEARRRGERAVQPLHRLAGLVPPALRRRTPVPGPVATGRARRPGRGRRPRSGRRLGPDRHRAGRPGAPRCRCDRGRARRRPARPPALAGRAHGRGRRPPRHVRRRGPAGRAGGRRPGPRRQRHPGPRARGLRVRRPAPAGRRARVRPDLAGAGRDRPGRVRPRPRRACRRGDHPGRHDHAPDPRAGARRVARLGRDPRRARRDVGAGRGPDAVPHLDLAPGRRRRQRRRPGRPQQRR